MPSPWSPNVFCLCLLWRRRGDDINMASAWLYSRNDVVADFAVLVAAAAVALSGSAWPDIVVGLLMVALFGSSAVNVIRGARRELRSAGEPAWRWLALRSPVRGRAELRPPFVTPCRIGARAESGRAAASAGAPRREPDELRGGLG